jgi:glycerol kinase
VSDGCIVAIDQGTTGSTVLVLDRTCSIRGQAYSEFTQHYPKPGWIEHDAEELWGVTLGVVEAALRDAGIAPENVQAIGIANQRETSLLWHRSNGRPIARAMVWQDRRTASLCDELKQEGLEPAWQEKTGLLIDPYFSATKIRWMLDHIDGLPARCADGEIAFGTIDSWLLWQLTGGACHVTDYSNASRTLLFNIRELDWDGEILARLDIPHAILPEVKASSCIYGETDPQVFFGQRIPVAGIAGDQQAALFGQACYHKGLGKNTYGTGSFLLMNTGNQPVASRERLLTTIAWGIGEEPVEYALEGNDDVYFVPAMVGLGAPHWDAYARGTIVGITRGTTRAHLARAALESICYQTRDVVEAMRRESGIDLRELRADGTAAENEFLMQFQSDLLGVPVEIPAITQTTALGAAYLAGLAIGFWQSREEFVAQWQAARRYEPRTAIAERDRLYARWQQAVERARGWARSEAP